MISWDATKKIYNEYSNEVTTRKNLASKYDTTEARIADVINYFKRALKHTVRDKKTLYYVDITHTIDEVFGFGDFLSKYTDDVFMLLRKLQRANVYTINEFEQVSYQKIAAIQYFGDDRLATVRRIKGVPEPMRKYQKYCRFCDGTSDICTEIEMPIRTVISDDGYFEVRKSDLVWARGLIKYCPVCGRRLARANRRKCRDILKEGIAACQ